jgi:hypothetical protein
VYAVALAKRTMCSMFAFVYRDSFYIRCTYRLLTIKIESQVL